MKTIRRRVASPVLNWDPAGPDHEYRIVVRNQDTGELRTIYQGFRTECRVPPDMRLSPDQLAFRVMARTVRESSEGFVRIQGYRAIPRLGDDHETPAPDLLVDKPTPGANQYRLVVRDPLTGRPLVDFVRPEPRFLLPVGLLRDGDFHYDLTAWARGRWRGTKGVPITPEMIAAADERAARLIPLPRPARSRITGSSAIHAPGQADRLSPESLAPAPCLLVVVDVTAAPELAPVADPADVVRRQWWSGDGTGAVETVALALEENGLRGQFQLDVLSSEALGDKAVSDLAHTLTARGHGVGLLLNADRWRGLYPDLIDKKPGVTLALAADRFKALTGQSAPAVSFSPGTLSLSLVNHTRRIGLSCILADRGGQERLPAWMRWRIAPFAVYDDLVLIPPALVLSTAAHVRDRTVRHGLSATDPMTAASAEAIVAAFVEDRPGLVVARIDPLALLLRRLVRSPEQTDAWNLALTESLPRWIEAGWERSANGFPVLDDRDEIKTEMMNALVAALGRTGLPSADPATVFTPAALRGWCETPRAYEPMIEQRRGPRALRRSGVRIYDAAYRQALGAPRA